jgi:hypothetical protein
MVRLRDLRLEEIATADKIVETLRSRLIVLERESARLAPHRLRSVGCDIGARPRSGLAPTSTRGAFL